MSAGIIILMAVIGAFWSEQPSLRQAPPEDFVAQNLANATPGRAQRTVRFSGEVSKGQSFEKEIAINLFFRLVPLQLGWTISVGNKATPENNFCVLVTPPYRGMNQIYIEGWHFRNADNSGPNEAGPKNVNAPQKFRDFKFVLNEADNRKAYEALQILLWQRDYSKSQIDEARNVHVKLTKGSGRLTIRELKLNTLVPGQQAGIDHMSFDVEMGIP